ncbi:MAG: signal peptidase II [bacterium]|nr:signal peptidase II [bacterium]
MLSRAPSLLLIAGVLLTDALFKFVVRRWLSGESVGLFPGVTLRVFENTRGPFGLLPLWLAVAISVLTLLGLGSQWTRLYQATDTRLLRLSLSFLVGGGIANLSERLIFGRTTDILWLGNVTAFNAADVAILGGGLGLLMLSWRALSFRSQYRARD